MQCHHFARGLMTCVLAAALTILFQPRLARAGITNPDISVIGQPTIRATDDPDDRDRKRIVADVGETEVVFDAYLNPYARGFFTLTIGEEGLELEEGYFSLVRGLPFDLTLKGGQYRAGFGRLNPAHPHTYPFAERFKVLETYLPGEESLNETGVSLARLLPVAGDFSLNASVDWFQGNSFRFLREANDDLDPLNSGGNDEEDLSRPAFLGRLSGFTMIGEQSALEFGASGTVGTNNVAAGTRTAVTGLDAKAKLWTSPRAYLALQGELLHVDREDAYWSPDQGYGHTTSKGTGGYVFADYNFATRYNLGASYERFEEPVSGGITSAAGVFAGYALMEETTAFRAGWVRSDPVSGNAFNTFTLRVIFSMGPHKAHQF